MNVNNFKLFRCDRNHDTRNKRGRRSGGVALYIRSDIAATTDPVFKYSNGVIKNLSVYSKKENLFITVLYRSPDNQSSKIHRSTSVQLTHALSKLHKVMAECCNNATEIIVCGDFNLPHASWPDEKPSKSTSPDERNVLSALNELCQEFFLTQLITESNIRTETY